MGKAAISRLASWSDGCQGHRLLTAAYPYMETAAHTVYVSQLYSTRDIQAIWTLWHWHLIQLLDQAVQRKIKCWVFSAFCLSSVMICCFFTLMWHWKKDAFRCFILKRVCTHLSCFVLFKCFSEVQHNYLFLCTKHQQSCFWVWSCAHTHMFLILVSDPPVKLCSTALLVVRNPAV